MPMMRKGAGEGTSPAAVRLRWANNDVSSPFSFYPMQSSGRDSPAPTVAQQAEQPTGQ